jgi:hypothetical protein
MRRAGRTRPGIYALCSDIPQAERPSFPAAEILRRRLDQVVLRLAIHGFDASSLAFFHQPSKTAIEGAHTALIALGAMDPQGRVTQIGHRMAKLPVRVELARMLVEAEQRGVLEPVATIAACLEVGDIRARDAQWTFLTAERKSDLLAVLDVFRAARNHRKKLEDVGVFRRNFFRATEIRRRLLELLSNDKERGPQRLDARDRQAVLASCLTGMIQHVYTRVGFSNKYSDGKDATRELARESVLSPHPDMIVGVPFDLPVKGRFGPITLHLITMASAVSYDLIREVAPHQLSTKSGIDPEYLPHRDQVWSTTITYLNDRKISEALVADPDHPRAGELFQRWLALELLAEESWNTHLILTAYHQAKHQRRLLNRRAGSDVFPIIDSYPQLVSWLQGRLQGASCLAAMPQEALELPPLDPGQLARIQELSIGRLPEHGGQKLSLSKVLEVIDTVGSQEPRSLRTLNQPKIANPTVDDLKARWNRR